MLECPCSPWHKECPLPMALIWTVDLHPLSILEAVVQKQDQAEGQECAGVEEDAFHTFRKVEHKADSRQEVESHKEYVGKDSAPVVAASRNRDTFLECLGVEPRHLHVDSSVTFDSFGS